MDQRFISSLGVPAALAAVLLASGCGGGDEGGNAKRFESGPKNEIAGLVDRLQRDARDGNADEICTDIFTDRLSGVIAVRNDVSCAEQVKRKLVKDNATFDVKSIRVEGEKAVARVVDFTGNASGLYFVKQSGEWRVDSVYDLDS
jgi:hypothetical protein